VEKRIGRGRKKRPKLFSLLWVEMGDCNFPSCGGEQTAQACGQLSPYFNNQVGPYRERQTIGDDQIRRLINTLLKLTDTEKAQAYAPQCDSATAINDPASLRARILGLQHLLQGFASHSQRPPQ
jgi:hypothetical protein